MCGMDMLSPISSIDGLITYLADTRHTLACGRQKQAIMIQARSYRQLQRWLFSPASITFDTPMKPLRIPSFFPDDFAVSFV
jgi:hypothetical protein